MEKVSDLPEKIYQEMVTLAKEINLPEEDLAKLVSEQGRRILGSALRKLAKLPVGKKDPLAPRWVFSAVCDVDTPLRDLAEKSFERKWTWFDLGKVVDIRHYERKKISIGLFRCPGMTVDGAVNQLIETKKIVRGATLREVLSIRAATRKPRRAVVIPGTQVDNNYPEIGGIGSTSLMKYPIDRLIDYQWIAGLISNP